MEKIEFSKYERARILGARALQLSMDAPVLLKVDDAALSNLNFDPLRIAEFELDSGVLPISVKRPLPERKEEKLEKIKIEDVATTTDEDKMKVEAREVKEIAQEGEIMELASPEDEFEEDMEEDSGAGEE